MISLFKTGCDEFEIDLATQVLKSGKLILGENVSALERELAAYLGCGDIVTCGSGTDALALAIEGACQRCSVIVPAFTFSASYEAVLRAGCHPILCDIDGITPSVKQIDAVRTDDTRAVILVHLYGWPAKETVEISAYCRDQGLILIEDCAQAFGAELDGRKVGTFGDAAAFSFYPTKPLGGIGDGGAVRPIDPKYVRARRNHGRTNRGQEFAGINSRLDEVNAAVLRRRLALYPQRLAYQRALVERFNMPVSPGNPAPHVFPVMVENRSEVQDRMEQAGIETRVHYDPPVSGLKYIDQYCPNADWVSRRVLSLPCHWGMTFSHVDFICRVLAGGKVKGVTGGLEGEADSPRGSQAHRAA